MTVRVYRKRKATRPGTAVRYIVAGLGRGWLVADEHSEAAARSYYATLRRGMTTLVIQESRYWWLVEAEHDTHGRRR
jgi:hypothetical protein